jgi:hypothetical protein
MWFSIQTIYRCIIILLRYFFPTLIVFHSLRPQFLTSGNETCGTIDFLNAIKLLQEKVPSSTTYNLDMTTFVIAD